MVLELYVVSIHSEDTLRFSDRVIYSGDDADWIKRTVQISNGAIPSDVRADRQEDIETDPTSNPSKAIGTDQGCHGNS